MTMRRVKLLCTALMLLASHGALAVSYPLPPEGSRLVGSAFTIAVPDNNTQPLESFAAQYGQGLSNMLEANPGVDVYLPHSGSTLTIPQQLILPDTVREGIVINVAEMRLYYYPPLGNSVEVLPIGIGQAGRETPRNWVTAVERKQEGPTWVPTANTRREYAKEGKTLPAMVPPGPDNPMGLYAIYIGRLYAIHGTNANFGIGLRVSQGCIRLRNDDIKFLFDNVPVGTRVQLIDQPVKYSVEPDAVTGWRCTSRCRATARSLNPTEKSPLPMTSALRDFTQGPGSEPCPGRADPAAPLRHAGEYQRHSGAGKFCSGSF
ncbi:L,D-transpeptidase ErfK [Klebsiella pneumoniae ISC21]|nr:L,D-transpeptidase ErfK [Klebsiella pneumoniae ISC21]